MANRECVVACVNWTPPFLEGIAVGAALRAFSLARNDHFLEATQHPGLIIVPICNWKLFGVYFGISKCFRSLQSMNKKKLS
jgi:hypothetical protein